MATWMWELNSIFCKLHMRTYPLSHPSSPWKLCKFNMWMLLLFGDPTTLPAEDMYVFILGKENFETVQQWLYLKETGIYCPQARVHRIKWTVLACQVVSVLSIYNYVWLWNKVLSIRPNTAGFRTEISLRRHQWKVYARHRHLTSMISATEGGSKRIQGQL